MSSTTAARVRQRSMFVGRVFHFIRNTLALIGLLLIIYHLCFDLSVVVSSSMAPTLIGEGGPGSDWVLSERISYWVRRPRRWEVVWFRNVEGFLVAKRVVGLPGDEVSLRDQRPIINGSLLPFPPSLSFLRYYSWGDLNAGKSVRCGDAYFVFGDDSKDSADSRFDGPVAVEEIRGRAWLIVWPPSRVGFVNP